MTVHLPTVKQLQYLVALRQHGHFGKAADACFVTQSTLSAGLRELETLLGVTLVERTRRVVRFTPLGREDRRQGGAGPARERGAGRPGAGRGPAAAWRAADGRHPDHRAVPAAGDAAAAARAWPSSSFSCARKPARPPATRSTAASSIACCWPCPYGCGDVDKHRLVRRPPVRRLSRGRGAAEPTIDAAAIDENRLLLLEDGHCLKDHALSACNRPELRAEATMMGTSLHTLVQMVDNGLGPDLRARRWRSRPASSTAPGSTPGRCAPTMASAGSR